MNCDHTIGVRCADDGGFILASEKPRQLKLCRESFNDWAANPYASPVIVASRKAMTDEELLADTHTMFAFCPDCGASLK